MAAADASAEELILEHLEVALNALGTLGPIYLDPPDSDDDTTDIALYMREVSGVEVFRGGWITVAQADEQSDSPGTVGVGGYNDHRLPIEVFYFRAISDDDAPAVTGENTNYRTFKAEINAILQYFRQRAVDIFSGYTPPSGQIIPKWPPEDNAYLRARTGRHDTLWQGIPCYVGIIQTEFEEYLRRAT